MRVSPGRTPTWSSLSLLAEVLSEASGDGPLQAGTAGTEERLNRVAIAVAGSFQKVLCVHPRRS